MNSLLIGVASSLIAATAVYLARHQFANLLNLALRRYFPPISGKYLWERCWEPGSSVDAYPDQRVYLHLTQLAGRVNGYSEVYSGEKLMSRYEVWGTISTTRVLCIRSECKTKGHHNYSVGIFKLDGNGEKFTGHSATLCVSCQDTTSSVITLTRI